MLKDDATKDSSRSWIVYIDKVRDSKRGLSTISQALSGLDINISLTNYTLTAEQRLDTYKKFQQTPGSVLISCEIMLGGIRTRTTTAIFVGTTVFHRLAKACCKPVNRIVVLYDKHEEDQKKCFSAGVDLFFSGKFNSLDPSQANAGSVKLSTPTCMVKLIQLPQRTSRAQVVELLSKVDAQRLAMNTDARYFDQSIRSDVSTPFRLVPRLFFTCVW